MPLRILIADDDVTIRHLLRRILEERPGWEVCGEAANGNDAVVQTEQLAPDLAIIDLAMPEKNGIEAAQGNLLPLPLDRNAPANRARGFGRVGSSCARSGISRSGDQGQRQRGGYCRRNSSGQGDIFCYRGIPECSHLMRREYSVHPIALLGGEG